MPDESRTYDLRIQVANAVTARAGKDKISVLHALLIPNRHWRGGKQSLIGDNGTTDDYNCKK